MPVNRLPALDTVCTATWLIGGSFLRQHRLTANEAPPEDRVMTGPVVRSVAFEVCTGPVKVASGPPAAVSRFRYRLTPSTYTTEPSTQMPAFGPSAMASP